MRKEMLESQSYSNIRPSQILVCMCVDMENLL